MPGFYDVNGNQPPKSNGSKKKKGFYSIDNKDTKNTLEYGGVTLGTVTNKGLKAIETNTLDSYTPETEEEKATIESYKSLKRKNEHEQSKQAKEKSRYKVVKETIGEPNKVSKLLKPDFKTTVKTSFGDVEVDLSPSTTKIAKGLNEARNTDAQNVASLLSLSPKELETKRAESKSDIAYETKLGDDITWDYLIHEAKVIDKEKIKNNPEFETNSKFKKKPVNYVGAKGSQYKVIEDGKEAEHIYNLVNGDKDAVGYESLVQANTYGVNDNIKYKHFTDDEKRIFNALWETEGTDSALEYAKLIDDKLIRRRINYQSDADEKYAKEHPFKSTVGSIITSPLTNTISGVGVVGDYLEDGKIDENSTLYSHQKRKNTTYNTVRNQIHNPIGKFFYNAGINVGEQTMAMAVGGGNKLITLGTRVIGGFADTVVSAKEKGLSDDKAFALGVVKAIPEVYFESKSFDALFDGNALVESAFDYLKKNLLTELTGELSTELAGDIADGVISGDLSDWNLSIAKYMAEGKSRNDALKLTLGDYAKKYAIDVGLSTLVSSGIMSGSPVLFNYTVTKATENSTIGKDVRAFFEKNYGKDVTNEYIKDTLMFYPKDSKVYKLATEAQSNIDAGKDVSNTLLGKIYRASVKQNNTKQTSTPDSKDTDVTENVTSTEVVDTSPIKIGDTFKANNEAESVIKVIGRNDNVTTVEVTYKNGESETMEVKNDFADSMINNPKYTRMATETAQDDIDTSVTETVDTTKTPKTEETTVTVEQVASVESTPISVGDVFTDTKNGDTIKIVARDEKTTTMEFTDKDGNVGTAEFDNNSVDMMNANPRYAKTESGVKEDTEASPVAKNNTVSTEDNTANADVVATDTIAVNDNVTEAKTINTETKAEATPITSNGTVKVGDIFVNTKGGTTFKVIARDNENTTIEKTTKGGKVTTAVFTNQQADNLISNPQYQQIDTNTAVTNETVDTTETTESVDTVENTVEADTTLKTLRNKVSLSELFKSATQIIIGEDCITSNRVVISKTDALVEKVKSLKTKAEVVENKAITMERFRSNDTSVTISGDAKVGYHGNDKYYVFKVNDKFYVCEQRFLDHFNNGANVIKAGANPQQPWNVFDTKGNLVGSFLPTTTKKLNLTQEQYEQLQSVSQVLGEKAEQKAKESTAPMSKGEINAIDKWDRVLFYNNGDNILISDSRMVLALTKEQFDYVKSNIEITPTELEGIATAFDRYNKYESWGEVTEVKVAPKDVIKGGVVCVVDNKGYLFSKAYYDHLKKHSNTISVVGDKGWTIALVGYDKNGNPTGMVLPIKNEKQTIDGVEMYTGDNKPVTSTPKSKASTKANATDTTKVNIEDASAENANVSQPKSKTPTDNAQNTPKSSESNSAKQTPTETENANTEQSVSDTEGVKDTSKKSKTTKTESKAKVTDIFDVITETKNHEGKYWSPKKIEQFYADNPDIDFIERIYQGDKNAVKELKEMLASIDDVAILEDLSWYVGETYKGKGRTSKANYETYKMETTQPYRGAVTKFRNAIKARINEIMTEMNNGTNLGVENGKVSLDEIHSLFTKLNSNDSLTELADKVFGLCKQLHLDISFVNKMLSRADGLSVGDIVQYKTSFFNDTAVADQEKARTILHELIHSCTVYALSVSKDPNARRGFASNPEVYHRLVDTAKQLEEIYNEIKDDADFKGMYGTKDVYEMVAELSNPEFVEKLQKKNLWDRIVDAICNLFGISKKSDAYSNIKACVDFLFNNFDEGLYNHHAKEQRRALRESGRADGHYSYSSIANTFFGDPNMTTKEFESKDYKQTIGYKNYVDKCLGVFMQTHNVSSEEAQKEIEESIDGIIKVAIASKKAGYDIFDDNAKRDIKDSKKRLLFSSLEPNSDYFTSSDISTICDKRKNFADIYDAIVKKEEELGVPNDKRFFNNVDNYFYIHGLMAEMGLTTPCRQCYVESMRKNLAPMAKNFLKLVGETDSNNKSNDQLYHQSGKNKGSLKSNNAELREAVLETLAEYDMSPSDLSIATLSTEDGLARLKIQAPLVYEAFNSFYGQSKPKMPKSATPFRFGELTALLTDEKGKIKQSLVDKINSTGGFRLQSYSDFQIQNYVDVLQTIFEAGTLGLSGHAYTKVPAFLTATEGTNLKRNMSIFMYKDGNEWKIDRGDSFPATLDELYDIVDADKSGNTSIIAVSQNEDMSAWIMANDNVGYGIPFHKSGMKMDTVRATDVKTEDGRTVKGYSNIKDHTRQQTEVWAKTTADHKANTKVKKGIDVYEFWDFNNNDNLSKNDLIKKNLMAYIDACEKAGYLPKFREYLINNGKVIKAILDYSKELGFISQDATVNEIAFRYKGYTIPYGYHKFLVDFGVFTPDGKASAISPLSLEGYDFDRAVEFFNDSEALHRNEILQQFASDGERQKMRDSNLSTEELSTVVQERRDKVADEIINRGNNKFSLSEDGGKNERNGLLSGNSRRTGNESTQEQTKGLSEADRKRTAEEIRAKGQTEEKVVDEVKLTLVKEEAYNDDMNSIVEANKAKGLNTHFLLGNGTYKFDTKKRILVDGMVVGRDVYLRYDGKFAPQTLNRHENVHDSWNTEETQTAKDTIINKLSKAEKKEILSRDRYKKYVELYDGNMDKVWEEFVADVLSGMSTFSQQFSEAVNNYWSETDTNLDNFKVSEYTHSTDAGGIRIMPNGSKIIPSGESLIDKILPKEYNTRGWSYGLFSTEDLGLLNERWKSALSKNYKDKTSDGLSVIKINNKVIFASGTYNNPVIESIIVYNAGNQGELTANEIVILEGEVYEQLTTEGIYDRTSLAQNLFEEKLCEVYNRKDYQSKTKRTAEDGSRRAIQPRGFKNFGYVGSYEFRDGIFLQDEAEVPQRTGTSNRRGYSINSTNYANTFYSYMAKVIDGIKQEKLGANSVVSYLKGKGVKNEEIKWSGIESWLEGKKSVTKAELQEFVAGSMLQIDEVTLDNSEMPYTEEQKTQIEEYEQERNDIVEELKEEWKKSIGTDIPMQHFGNNIESSVTDALLDVDKQIKESTEAGKEMVEARKQLRAMFAEDDLGFDSAGEAYAYANRNPYDFMDYDLTEKQRAILERFISAKENFKTVEGISKGTKDRLREIASRADAISRKISKIESERSAESEKHKTKWDEYKLDGGENYREITFKMPNSTYTNDAMSAHWSGSIVNGEGVIAHARVQDITTDDGKKMLFIEEIQSDWHNAGHKKGYRDGNESTLKDNVAELNNERNAIREKLDDIKEDVEKVENSVVDRVEMYPLWVVYASLTGRESEYGVTTKVADYIRSIATDEETAIVQEEDKLNKRLLEINKEIDNLESLIYDKAPDAPFKDNYHEYVLKRLIRDTVENGYDSIGWTTADIQSQRWSNDFAEGYRIEYDQDIPKFLNKYGKKWGAKVGKETLQGTEVWSMPITESMKDSVLYEGQPMYSLSADDYVQTKSKAVMTDERIDYLIEDSGAGNRQDYANYWITSISPTDFINLTTTEKTQDRAFFDEWGSEWNPESNMSTYDYMGELKKNMRQTPYLAIDINTGEVVGHEGRHRMRALEQNGITSAEIRVEFRDEDGRIIKYSPDGKRLQIKDAVKLINQFGTKQTATIKNVIPLNEDYRNEIFENYGDKTAQDADIHYSISVGDESSADTATKWDEALEKYGAIQKGETPTRDIDVPRKRAKNEPVSQFARTALEAGITPNEVIDDFQREVMFGKMAHEVITDKTSEEKAIAKIKHIGFEEAVKEWDILTKNDKIGKEDFVFGMVLYNQAITNKDYKLAMKLISDLTVEASHSAQVLQSVRMLKKMSPDGTLYYLEKSVEKMNEEFLEMLGDKFKGIKIAPELMKELYEAKTEEERNEALEKIEQNIADQIPSTLLDKWNAWRYLAMLGNVRTHGRNIWGNMSNWGARKLKNLLGAVMEKTIPVEQRTKSIKKTKESVAFSKEDAEVMKDILTGTGGKYEMANKIQQKREIFKTKWLELIRRKNFDFLEAEDWWFLKDAYQDSLAQLISARKIDVETLKSGTSEANDLLNRIRAYAINEAKVATFRQMSDLGNVINRTKRELSKSKNIGKKGVGLLLEGVMPFTNVPINIAKQGVAYSPIGLTKGIYEALHDVKKGNKSASEAIDTISKGFTGTAIVALGVLLRSMGWLVAETDDDEKKKEYDRMRGYQSYALQIGDTSYTIDWLTPSSLPLFVGVELCDLANDDGTSGWDIINALSRIADPMVELSVLQGVSDALNNAKYTDENPFVTVPMGMLTSYLGQALPTLGGQVARLIDNEQKKVYIEKGEGFLTGQFKRFIQTSAKKIPLATRLLEPQIDAWGETKTYGSVFERILESTISPGYFSEITTTKVDEELHKLFEETGDNSVYPSSNTVKSLTLDKHTYNLNAEQSREYAEERGRRSLENVQKVINHKNYDKWSDEKKLDWIKKAYENAKDEAKKHILKKHFSVQ